MKLRLLGAACLLLACVGPIHAQPSPKAVCAAKALINPFMRKVNQAHRNNVPLAAIETEFGQPYRVLEGISAKAYFFVDGNFIESADNPAPCGYYVYFAGKEESLVQNAAGTLVSSQDFETIVKTTAQYINWEPPSSEADRDAVAAPEFVVAQILPHWNVDPEAPGAANIRFSLQITVQPDGRVLPSRVIIDKDRYAVEPAYRAAVDAGRRALLMASPLKVPADHPDIFKNTPKLIVEFDPMTPLRRR